MSTPPRSQRDVVDDEVDATVVDVTGERGPHLAVEFGHGDVAGCDDVQLQHTVAHAYAIDPLPREVRRDQAEGPGRERRHRAAALHEPRHRRDVDPIDETTHRFTHWLIH